MGIRLKFWAAAALILVGLGAGTWVLTRSALVGSTSWSSNAHPTGELGNLEQEPSSAAPREVAANAAGDRTSAAALPVAAGQHENPTRVEARILDETRTPIAGASVAFSRAKTPSPASDAAGSLVVEADLHGEAAVSESLVFSARNRATRVITANLERERTTYLGDVVLQPGGAVSGRVVDESVGPVAGVTVGPERDDRPMHERMFGMFRSHWISIDEPQAQSAEDGTFRLEGMGIGSRQLVATKGFRLGFPGETARSESFEVRAGRETTGIQITLRSTPPERTVSALVVDPQGKPVPHASVVVSNSTGSGGWGGTILADDRGRFEQKVLSGSATELFARDRKARWDDTPHVVLHDGDSEVTLQFTTARRVLDVTVTDGAGRTIERWSGACRAADRDEALVSVPNERHPGGTFRVGLPTIPFVLVVEARGHARVELGPLDPAALGPTLTVVMRPQPGITGRVVGADGPIAGARVRLFREADARIEHNGFDITVDPTPRDEVLTEADGTFQLTLRESGRFVVRADRSGAAPAEAAGLNVAVDTGIQGLELVLSAGGSIEGRVLKPAGVDPAGSIVAISRGDPFAVTQRVGPDGRFSFEHLVPGPWMVSATEKEIRPGGGSTVTHAGLRPEPPSNCAVFEGRTTRFDLDQSEASRACVLLGKLDFRGSNGFDWMATFAGGDPNGAPPVRLDWTGGFRLATRHPGKTKIRLTAVGGDLDGTILTATVDLRVGETRWQAEADKATLSLHGAGSVSEPGVPLVLVVARDDGSSFIRPLLSLGDGDCEVPAGQGRVLWLDETVQRDSDPRTWTGGTRVTLAPGATLRVERP